ncbi:MAG: alcohol dehydrogenase family protein [Chloroflexota bacterium]
MRAALLTGFGGPENLVLRDDVPRPSVAAEDVLIEVGACGVNNTDLWTRQGAYGREDDPNAISSWQQMQFPRIQGSDIAGRIVEVGTDVSPKRIGERVIVDPTLYRGGGEGLYEAGFIGSGRDGGFAEFTSVPAVNAHPIESNLSDAELATFPVAYVTGEHMLNRAHLQKGETILITGASGGVGSGLVQLSRIREARVIAIAGRGKEDAVRQIGAEIVVTRQVDDLYQAVIEAIGQRPVDVIADVVGGENFPTLIRLLRTGGRIVTAGAIAGPVIQLDLRTIYLNHIELIGSTLGTNKEFRDLVGYIETGRLIPLLARTYSLENIDQAQKDFERKDFVGKLVITP